MRRFAAGDLPRRGTARLGYHDRMPSAPARPSVPPDAVTRWRDGLRAFGSALREFWQGYWDRPIGC